MTEITVYGLAACDTCRRTRAWLERAGIGARWHDVRAHGLSPDVTGRLAKTVGWDQLINRRSRTWRMLDETERARALENPAAALADHPTLMKRPVLETGDDVLVGFDEASWATALGTDL
jgi:Spx/MgsR family transcriptional regulator